MNDTKVVPARLWLTKPSGGKIQVLLAMNELRPNDELVRGIVDRKVEPGTTLMFRSGASLFVERQEEQSFYFRPSVGTKGLLALLMHEGVTPIPPYIKHAAMTESRLRQRYQSIIGKHPASVAAPTASLHFTSRVFERIAAAGHSRTDVTLHVGAGTFAPIDETTLKNGRLFDEYYEVGKKSAERILTAKKRGRPVVPVGTTAMRTIESVARKYPNEIFRAESDRTDIFIHPPYGFRIADALITNFHVPRSSLMLLVDAFLRHKGAKRRILDLYDIAIKEGFRFYSFGDGMLIK
jgi:S-adenosylmethionine:tRNA ribosyltransferase-isomerase